MSTSQFSSSRWPAASFGTRRRTVFFIVVLLIAWAVGGCATVKPWQKGDLAVAPMQAEDDRCHRFERNIEAYREGAVGANGGKSGGGCGCT